jgi:Predicted acetyltransferase
MSEETIEIRTARADEFEAINSLTRLAYEQYATIMAPSAWEGLRSAIDAALASTDPRIERIVALRNGQLVGSVMLFSPGLNLHKEANAGAEWPELRMLAVHPDERGKGLGRLLVEACIERVRANGGEWLGLHTSESLKAAIRLYERLGFERDPERDFQPEGAELVMGYRKAL